MRYLFLLISVCLISLLSLQLSKAQSAPDTLPDQTGLVNDFEEILTDVEEDTLTNIIAHHLKLTTDQMIIITVKDLPKPYTSLYQYTLDLANYWSKNDTLNGFKTIIAISANLRSVRIQLNRKLEPHIDNKEIKEIIDDRMIPYFLKEQYYEGIRQGTLSMIERLNKIERVTDVPTPVIDLSE